MSKTTKIVIAVVAIVILIGATVAVFAAQPRESVSDSVLTETVERRDVTTTVAASGIAEPIKELSLSFNQSGRLATLEVSVGDTVDAGDPLATLDPRDLEVALVVAQGSLATARAGVSTATQAEATAQVAINSADEAMARAELALADARVRAANRSQARDAANRAKSVAEAQQNAAGTQMSAAQAQQNQAGAALSTARAQLAAAEKALDEAALIAPMAGTVVSIASQVGEALGSAGPAGSVGDGFIVLADLSDFVVTADFAEADVVGIEVGQEVSVTFDAIPGGGVTGIVLEVGLVGGVDPAGGRLTTYEVTISVPQAPQGLRVGMTAQASITTETRSDVLAAPVTALIEQDGQTFVQLLLDDGTLSAVEVSVGIQGGYWIEITSGLTGGERVVTGATGEIPGVGGGGFGGPPEGTPGG